MSEEIEIKADEIKFKLKEMHDFNWLNEIGKPFVVFDQQDSGNLCFGVENNGRRIFVKYAGAKTTDFNGNILEAIGCLKSAIQSYIDLKHEVLIEYKDSFETANGFVAIFEWFDGENMHPHWIYPPPAKYENPNSPFYKFRRLPIRTRLDALDKIFSFHCYVEQKGYQAVDFYDGSLLFNFERNELKICDIDFYAKKPYVNTMCWGSERFKAPEDYIKGVILDERTNVFNMGAIAFSLIGDELNRNLEKWEGPEALFKIAQTATMPNRNDRFGSVQELYQEWKKALNWAMEITKRRAER